MSKFSPGPWRWDNGILVDANGAMVADVRRTAGGSTADLIAAAPEMYGLLRSMADAGPWPEARALLARIDGDAE